MKKKKVFVHYLKTNKKKDYRYLLKRNVLSYFSNIATLPAVLGERGREFQIIGSVTVKALPPNVFKLDLGTINDLESWDLRTLSGT